MAASDEDVVKAYRRQLSRHHPDKLKANGLPESMVEHAKQRTQQIIEAYELIRVPTRAVGEHAHSSMTSCSARTPTVSAAGPAAG